MKVYQAARAYRPQSKFQTWIYTIAKNISLNELRRNRGSVVSLDEPFLSEEGELNRDVEDPSGARPDEEILRQETMRAVRQAIHALPENQRMAVILRRYEQFSYEEISQTMRVSVKAVKSLLSRAKENLKNKLLSFLSINITSNLPPASNNSKVDLKLEKESSITPAETFE